MSDNVPLSQWQIIAMVFAIVGAFWYVMQDLRASQKEYLTIREHAEYVTNARADLKRVEDENKLQLSKDTFKSWKEQRTNLTNDIQIRLMDRVTRAELLAHLEKDKDLLTNLQRQIDLLRSEMLAYHNGKPP